MSRASRSESLMKLLPSLSSSISTPRKLTSANKRISLTGRWCQPCRVLTPLLKGVTGPETEYDLMTLDVDQHPDLAAEYKVGYLDI
jgi:thioredoxin 1